MDCQNTHIMVTDDNHPVSRERAGSSTPFALQGLPVKRVRTNSALFLDLVFLQCLCCLVPCLRLFLSFSPLSFILAPCLVKCASLFPAPFIFIHWGKRFFSLTKFGQFTFQIERAQMTKKTKTAESLW